MKPRHLKCPLVAVLRLADCKLLKSVIKLGRNVKIDGWALLVIGPTAQTPNDITSPRWQRSHCRYFWVVFPAMSGVAHELSATSCCFVVRPLSQPVYWLYKGNSFCCSRTLRAIYLIYFCLAGMSRHTWCYSNCWNSTKVRASPVISLSEHTFWRWHLISGIYPQTLHESLTSVSRAQLRFGTGTATVKPRLYASITANCAIKVSHWFF